jgi:hypothetical protein
MPGCPEPVDGRVIQLPRVPDHAALTCMKPAHNAWRFYRIAVWRRWGGNPESTGDRSADGGALTFILGFVMVSLITL